MRLDDELNSIKETLTDRKCCTSFNFIRKDDLKLRELPDLILKYRPQVIHFSGHGDYKGVYLLDENGEKLLVPFQSLNRLFENRELFAMFNVDLLFLNSCYSDEANAIKHLARNIIGVSGNISDNSAIELSTNFYKALCQEFNIKKAYEYALSCMELFNVPDIDRPILIE